MAAVRAAGVPFGVNLFAPNPLPVDREAFGRYAEELRPEADTVGVQLDAAPREDDDAWREKVEVLLGDPPALVSFTFGIPPREDLAALRDAGCLLLQGVTSPGEAAEAAASGLDALVVQSSAAGGHWGTLTPHDPPPQLALPELVAAVRTTTRLPMIAAGGVATPADVTAALASGADAVMVGTALLRAPESGASDVHKAALADHSRGMPVLTRAFTGRPARGLPNEFMARYEAIAPMGYP